MQKKKTSIQQKTSLHTFLLNVSVSWFPNLPRGSDSSNDGEADNDPGYQQRQGHFDVEAAALCDGAGRVQSLPVPEIGRS